jgi:hypothetical protein
MAIQERVDQESELIIKNVKRYGWHATYISVVHSDSEAPSAWLFMRCAGIRTITGK